tara:strand:- start:72 stop:257 length:186 start_codon:yes stop_codon:yes gene_type:complete
MTERQKEKRAINAIMKALDLDPDQNIKIGFGQAKRKDVWFDILCTNGFDCLLTRIVEVHCK